MDLVIDLAQAVAIISACFAVISGIGAWKREFIGKRQIELAEDVLTRFFEVRDAVAFIRNPFARVSEGESRQEESHESSDEAQLLNRAYIVFERYSKKEVVFNSFRALKYRFMATFGASNEKIFAGVEEQLATIFTAAQLLGTHYWKRQGRVHMEPEEFQVHLKEMREHEDVFWEQGKNDDPIRVGLSKLQSQLEVVLTPCFSEPMQSYNILTFSFWRTGFAQIRNG